MKGFKKFLLYLFIIIVALLVILLGVFAFMYFSPNTSVLGFEYVSYNDTQTKVYNSTSALSIQNVESVEIYAENCDIYIYPNGQSKEIKIAKNLSFTGFAKDVNSNLRVYEDVQNKQYEENSSNLKAFIFKLEEPSGWVSKNKSKIEVYIANDLNLDTVLVKTNGGNVYYNSSLDGSNFVCSNLFLKTEKNGQININNNQYVSNYYFATENGAVNLGKSSSLNANQILFETANGSFVYSNSEKNATLNASLKVKSSGDGKGPTIIVDQLNGNFNAQVDNGTFNFDKVGSYGNYKTFSISADKCSLNLGTIYANVSVLSKTNVKCNNVVIDKLIYQSQVNTFETGEGNFVVNSLDGSIAVETSSGQVNIKKAKTTSDVCVYTKSGSINVNYEYSDENHKDNVLKILTHTGSINIDNVSCTLDVKVLANSASSSCNIGFSAVSTSDNQIYVVDRLVNLYFINSGSFTRCRILSVSKANIIGTAIGSDISTHFDDEGDQNNDYILDEYEDYGYSYRINYNKGDSTYTDGKYNQMGKIFIKSTKDFNVYSKIV